MVGDNSKKLKTSIEDDQIDSELIVFVEKLQEIQDELEKINEKASDEVLELEKKYNEIRKPVYDKRNEIVKSIPDFWMTAFLSHPSLCDYLNPEDQKIFRHLTTIEVEDSKDVKSGYSVTFNFSANPYFEDTKLTKTFNFLDDGTIKVTSTSIKWKEGMRGANGVDGEKNGNKRALDEQSFFGWFEEIKQSEDEFSDEIAELIREDLWPNPLNYFNAEAEEQEFEGDEEDEEGKGESSDDDDDNDEE